MTDAIGIRMKAWTIEPTNPIGEFDDSEFLNVDGDPPREGDPGYGKYTRAYDAHNVRIEAEEEANGAILCFLNSLGFVTWNRYPHWVGCAVFQSDAEQHVDRLFEFGNFGFIARPYQNDLTLEDAFQEATPNNIAEEFSRRDEETADKWAARVAMTADRAASLAELWEVCGHDPETFKCVGRRNEAPQPIKFLVGGLIPAGLVTLLIGGRHTGKSTLLTQLCVTVARGGGDFCGFDVLTEACDGLAVQLFGEDDQPTIRALTDSMDPEGAVRKFFAISKEAKKPLSEHLSMLEPKVVSLMVVDPARVYLDGNEDSSETISNFFAPLEDFARRKQCAVVVAHHLIKSAQPSSLTGVFQNVRGSGVFLDRARVTICMYRKNGYTGFGIPTINGDPQHNIPPMYPMFVGERVLMRNDKTMLHTIANDARLQERAKPNGGDAFEHAQSVDASICEAVLSAVSRLTGSGARVTRTGKHGLYESRPDELSGCSRGGVRAAVDRLMADGRLAIKDGALNAPERETPTIAAVADRCQAVTGNAATVGNGAAN